MKLASCAAFRKRLRATGGALIAEALPKAGVDSFWSTYLDPVTTVAVKGRFPGSNMMGQLLMRIRATMKDDDDDDDVDATAPPLAPPPARPYHHQQQQQQQRQERHPCNNCGERGHPTTRCWHPQPLACRACGTTGHKAKFCRGGPHPARPGQNSERPQPVPLFNSGHFPILSYGNYYA